MGHLHTLWILGVHPWVLRTNITPQIDIFVCSWHPNYYESTHDGISYCRVLGILNLNLAINNMATISVCKCRQMLYNGYLYSLMSFKCCRNVYLFTKLSPDCCLLNLVFLIFSFLWHFCYFWQVTCWVNVWGLSGFNFNYEKAKCMGFVIVPLERL